MSQQQIDVNDIVNGLLDYIAGLSKENAMLKVQLNILAQQQESGGDDVNDTE